MEKQGEAAHGRQEPFRLQWVGWLFVIAMVAQLSVIGWASIVVVRTMSSTPSFFEKVVKDRNEIGATLIVTLEYQSNVIKTQGIQIAYGLLIAMVFVATGMLLFAIEATGAFSFSAEVAGKKAIGKVVAPGLTCIILGAIIAGIAVNKDVSSTFAVGLDEGQNLVNLRTGEVVKPPRSGQSRVIDGAKSSSNQGAKNED